MTYLSVCSGIEAATVAWHPLGWVPIAFSEIEPFPCAVLAHHYSSVPNLGDMTAYKEWQIGAVDLLVGGTPCQSFSVAGLRKGLDDPRGNLMLVYLAIARRFAPRWVVWENVPGVISDKTGALRCLLDGLEELGYIIDIDILDAQFHGVPQRRRRVFVCGEHRDDLLKAKTDSSALTIGQCWQEILHSILIEKSNRFAKEQGNSDSAFLSRDGVVRRMQLFGLAGEQKSFGNLRKNLIAAFQRCQIEQKNSDVRRGEREKERIREDQSMASETGSLYSLTEESLSNTLEESYEVMKSYITSIGTNSITFQQIYICSRAVLLIAKLTVLLNPSSPCFWSAALSSLNALEEFIDYARSASSDLFGDLERVQAWRDFIREAEPTNDALADIGIECFGQVFPIRESLRGYPPPSREAGEKVALPVTSRVDRGGEHGNIKADHAWTGQLISKAVNAHGGSGRMDGKSETFITGTLNANGKAAGSATQQDAETGMLIASSLPSVRRLTPTESERLQGFPDGYTNIPWGRKSIRTWATGDNCADGPRYKALGNSMAVPCMAWLGERIKRVVEASEGGGRNENSLR